MNKVELPNLWDNTGMKLVSWCFSYPGLSCLLWWWDLWYFSTADTWGFRGKRGEQGVLFGNCYGFVCIKVVSPRGSNQEYRQGVLSTLGTHLCKVQTQRGAVRQEQISIPALGCILSVLIFGHVLLQRCVGPVSFSDTSHLVMRCSPHKVSMGGKIRCRRNDSQFYSGSYLLILVSTEKVRVGGFLGWCEFHVCQLPFRWDDHASEMLKTPAKLQSWLKGNNRK